ncbi:sugar MFS transporter [Luteitalea sp.]|uniref:MFS transporter n=1 Tax=Luteitalea sp. TaxID=2004800 RepID=UPI0025BF6B59|nr:MFS transporter [Luteitalea sp.]
MNQRRLFIASCVSLIATAMSFAIRGDILGQVQVDLSLTDVQTGWVATAAFWGFGLSILFGGPLCDLLGMGTIMRLAAAGHIVGALLTVFSTNFTTFFLSTVVVGVANGFVEAAINPLIATIYPQDKTSKLTTLHAWFPGGIVIGGVLAFAMTQAGFGWKAKTLTLLIPSVIYLVMFMGQKFPATEREAAGVPFGDMFKDLTRPLFILVWFCMILTAGTELGAGSWIPTIFNRVTQSATQAGILQVVWINMVMYLMRQFGHNISHKIAPTGLIAVSAIVASFGLYMFSHAATVTAAFAWAGVFAVGIAFWWPTMIGITSERFPRSGALGMAVIGATGSFATALSGPIMGWLSATYGTDQVLPIWSALPLLLVVIFGAIYMADRARGGYRAETIS